MIDPIETVRAVAGTVDQVKTELVRAANDTPRGQKTTEMYLFEHFLKQPDTKLTDPQITFMVRRNEVFGKHFHAGNNSYDIGKNPEMIAFVYGKVELALEDVFGGKRQMTIEVPFGRVMLLTIPRYVYHRFDIGEEGSMYIEVRANRFDVNNSDCINEPEFREIQKAIATPTN